MIGNACAAVQIADVLAKAHKKPPVNARVVLPRENSEEEVTAIYVTILGRDEDVLLVQDRKRGQGLIRLPRPRVIQCEFELDYDASALADFIKSQDWAGAVRTLSAAVRLVLPYLDVNDNNGLELAMDLGTYMVSSADREMKAAEKGAGDRERALKQYDAACQLFLEAGKAEWSPFGNVALLKACRALISQGKNDEAAAMLDEINEPLTDDAAYGHYWLAQAELMEHNGKTLDALNAVVKSVVFANKDIETFPSSLLLSADCYAKLEEYHRARDIYYEVAELFIGTDWELDALLGLKKIMDDKKTLETEKAAIESVFFNVDEDMNKISEELLEERADKLSKALATGGRKDEEKKDTP